MVFCIWIFGCFINCIILNKTDKEQINYLSFDYRINIIEDLIKVIFIFSSFIGLIIYFWLKKYNADN
jgi:hypothetical protein